MKNQANMMRPLLVLALITGVFLFLACKSSRKAVTPVSNEKEPSGDSLFASIERTPCFGRCPTYRISIYKSGYVVYEAIQWVADTGIFYTFITQKQLGDITAMAEKVGFAEMKDSYHDPNIVDVPSTFTALRIKGKIKKIDNTFGDPPRELIDFEKYLDGLFTETKWKRIKQ